VLEGLMSKIVSVKLDESLFQRLDRLAKVRGVSKSSIIKKGIEMVTSKASDQGDEEFVKTINRALRYNRPISVKVDWDKITKELSETSPRWKTVEEAMDYTRRRI